MLAADLHACTELENPCQQLQAAFRHLSGIGLKLLMEALHARDMHAKWRNQPGHAQGPLHALRRSHLDGLHHQQAV